MEHAHYGRMRDSHCLTSTAHLGCYADVLPQLDARCSGHRSCKVIFLKLRLLSVFFDGQVQTCLICSFSNIMERDIKWNLTEFCQRYRL